MCYIYNQMQCVVPKISLPSVRRVNPKFQGKGGSHTPKFWDPISGFWHIQDINPLTPGAFFQTHIFWTFWRQPMGQSSLNLFKTAFATWWYAVLHLALRYFAFLLRRVLKSKFWVTYIHLEAFQRFWIFSLAFLFILSFCISDWPSIRLASSSKISEKVSLRWVIFTTE